MMEKWEALSYARAAARIKHFSTCQNTDLLPLPLMLSGLGKTPPTHFCCLVETGWQTMSPFRADGCHGVIFQTGETRAEEFSSFPLYPKIVAEPWEEPKRSITSTMVPLIVTYFRPAGRTRCCKTPDNKVIVNCAEGRRLHGHLHEHILHQLREHTKRKSGLNTCCRLPGQSGLKIIWTESRRK